MTVRETKFFENLIIEKMRKLFSHMAGHSSEILDPEGARDYVCSVCDVPLKRCTVHPGYLCCLALKGGSELLELEAALRRVRNGEYGLCSLCGKKITKKYLTIHPTAVFCDQCLRSISVEEEKLIRRSGENLTT